MRLVTFSHGGGPRTGVVVGDRVIDLNAASRGEAPSDMLALIEGGEAALNAVRHVADAAAAESVPLSQVKLHAPIPRPRRNIFALGWNYVEHLNEGARVRGEERKLPEYPIFFSKAADIVIGHEEPILYEEHVTQQVDWEVELGVVIGTGGRNIEKERALEHVFGYTVANDVSARDLQWRHGGQWFKGKSLDTFCPLGPWLVTRDEIPNVQDLRLTSRVNGETMQDSNTRHMIFGVAAIMESLSQGLTLHPGDIIITGTPDGVGFARKPPVFLKHGDVAEMEIEGIGVLRNQVVCSG